MDILRGQLSLLTWLYWDSRKAKHVKISYRRHWQNDGNDCTSLLYMTALRKRLRLQTARFTHRILSNNATRFTDLIGTLPQISARPHGLKCQMPSSPPYSITFLNIKDTKKKPLSVATWFFDLIDESQLQPNYKSIPFH